MPLPKLSLPKVIEDIQNLFGQISSPRKYAELDGTAMSFHVLAYLRFLETNKFIIFDRTSDRLAQSQKGLNEIKNAALWTDNIQEVFGHFIAPVDGFERPTSDDTQEIIQIDDGVEILDAELLEELPSEEVKLYSDEESEAEIEGYNAEDGGTQPEIVVPSPLKTNIENNEPNRITPTPSEPKVTQDTFSSRKLSNSSDVSQSPESGYEREELIGAGAYGSVFHAKQLKLNRYVALKEVKSIFDVFASMQREDIIDRFSKIVQTQASLLHPNIIQIIDYEVGAQFPYVIMPYAPNGNLRRVIESEGRPDLQISLKYFFQILHALNSAHDKGITHGGIKPENVVLDQAGNALVTDFGISSVAGVDHTQAGASQIYVGVGTISYMSPEQFRNPNSSTVKSDIYSLGIMFYEMLTGKVPGRRSPMPSSFYPDIPRKLDDIFDRMSMDDPAERYDSVEEILRELYETPAVMKIIDKRSGFLFLRDPLTHGAIGMEGLSNNVDVELPEIDADDSMLNKLDKYGQLFDGGEE